MKFTDHPLLTDSLVITKPIALRSRWPIAVAVTLHAAAAGGLMVQGLFHFERLQPPELRRNRIPDIPVIFSPAPHGSPRSGGGDGGGNPKAGVKKPEIRIPRPPEQPAPPQPPIASVEQPAPEEGNGNGNVPGSVGSGNNPDGKGGYEGTGDNKSQPPGTGGEGELVVPYRLTESPVVSRRVEPIYPESARSMGLEGRVILQFIIEEDGSVSDIKVIEASNGMFREPALQAARQWKFTAAAMDGRKVRTYKSVVMKFQLHA